MEVLGIDFTSRPSRRKPLTCLSTTLEDTTLFVDPGAVRRWPDFAAFEAALRRPGPWVAGMDFPFGQTRRFLENIGWPADWSGYVTHVGDLTRQTFRDELTLYRTNRPRGDKEHRRATDLRVGSISPQKLHGVPVGLMFFEGAPRLIRAGVTIPLLQSGDPERIVVEAYPGVLARFLVGRDSYKNDMRSKQNDRQCDCRHRMLDRLRSDAFIARYGLTVRIEGDPAHIVEDAQGDDLDALLCAVQAAWAWIMIQRGGLGTRVGEDTALEGWIADPHAMPKTAEHDAEDDRLRDSRHQLKRTGSLFGSHPGSVRTARGVDLTRPPSE